MRYVLAGLFLVGAAACGKPEPPAAQPPAAGGRAGGGAAPVSVAQVVERAMPVNARAVGTVATMSSVDIRSQVTGILLKVSFAEGQEVKAGDVLFTLDARPFQATLDQALAVLSRDKAQSGNADELLRRSEELLAKGLVPKADRDTLAANAAALHGTLAADTAAVETARLQLQFTKITAPVSGRTGALISHEGALVRANDTTPMVTISQTSPIYVAFAVPARLLPKLRVGKDQRDLKVQASIPGVPESIATGTLTFIDSSVDPTTDTIKVKAAFPNDDHMLWPGQYVDVTLQLAVEPHAIVVPTAAMQSGQQGQFVYVVRSDKSVEARPVRVAWTDGATTVIESGLTPDDQVVTDGQLRLTPGAKVSVKPAVGSSAGPKDAPADGR